MYILAYAGVSTSFLPKDDKWVIVEYKKSTYPPPPDSVDTNKGDNSNETEKKKEDNSAMDALTSSSETGSHNEDESLFEDISIDNGKDPSFENLTIEKEEIKSDEDFEVVSGNGDSNSSLFTLEDFDPESEKEDVQETTLKNGDSDGLEVGEEVALDVENNVETMVITPENHIVNNHQETAVIDTVQTGASATIDSAQSLVLHPACDSGNAKKHKKLSRVSKGLSSHASLDLPPQMCQSMTHSGSIPSALTKQMSMSCISESSSSNDLSFFQNGIGALNFEPIKAAKHHIDHSPLTAFRHLPIVKNPYMSPLLASDELLKDLPPVYLVVSC